jgi:hypothetical protein
MSNHVYKAPSMAWRWDPNSNMYSVLGALAPWKDWIVLPGCQLMLFVHWAQGDELLVAPSYGAAPEHRRVSQVEDWIIDQDWELGRRDGLDDGAHEFDLPNMPTILPLPDPITVNPPMLPYRTHDKGLWQQRSNTYRPADGGWLGSSGVPHEVTWTGNDTCDPVADLRKFAKQLMDDSA